MTNIMTSTLVLATTLLVLSCGCVDQSISIKKASAPSSAYPTEIKMSKGILSDEIVVTGKVISVKYRSYDADAIVFEDGVVLPCRKAEQYILKLGKVHRIVCTDTLSGYWWIKDVEVE